MLRNLPCAPLAPCKLPSQSDALWSQDRLWWWELSIWLLHLSTLQAEHHLSALFYLQNGNLSKLYHLWCCCKKTVLVIRWTKQKCSMGYVAGIYFWPHILKLCMQQTYLSKVRPGLQKKWRLISNKLLPKSIVLNFSSQCIILCSIIENQFIFYSIYSISLFFD